MSKLPYVYLYASYLDSLAPFTDAERGRLLYGMLLYSQSGETPVFKGRERLLWPTLVSQLNRDIQKYESRCEANRSNAAKGGRPKKNQKTDWDFSQPKKPNENENDNDNDKENKNENDKENENERENDSGFSFSASPLAHPLMAPDAKAVQLYCLEAGLDIDPNRFVDYYASTGWMRKGSPIRDWKAAARCWASREPEDH